MTGAAIGMDNNPLTIAVFFRGWRSRVIALMTMLVMTEMRNWGRRRLVPAICGGGTPDELELHHEQQEDEKPASH